MLPLSKVVRRIASLSPSTPWSHKMLKIFCNAVQNFPKERVKPGVTSRGGKPPNAEKMK